MNAEAQQLRETYAAKDTEELVELAAAGTLTLTAQRIINEELQLRGIDQAVVLERKEGDRQEVVDKTHEFFNSHLASLPARFFAKQVDFFGSLLLLLSISLLIDIFLPQKISYSIAKLLMLVWILYLLFKDGRRGQSFGKQLLRIRVVKETTREPCTYSQSCVRNIFSAAGPLDWLFAAGDSKKRLGDRIAGTIVIKISNKNGG